MRGGRRRGPWLELLDRLRIASDPPPDATQLLSIAKIARDLDLPAHDAAYIELAARRRLPLLTFDEPLQRAALSRGIELAG